MAGGGVEGRSEGSGYSRVTRLLRRCNIACSLLPRWADGPYQRPLSLNAQRDRTSLLPPTHHGRHQLPAHATLHRPPPPGPPAQAAIDRPGWSVPRDGLCRPRPVAHRQPARACPASFEPVKRAARRTARRPYRHGGGGRSQGPHGRRAWTEGQCVSTFRLLSSWPLLWTGPQKRVADPPHTIFLRAPSSPATLPWISISCLSCTRSEVRAVSARDPFNEPQPFRPYSSRP